MNNIVVLPIVIPILAGIMMIFFYKHVAVQRGIGIVSMLGQIVWSFILLQQVHTDSIQTLYLGGWRPPFGIVLVADMFAVLLLLAASIVAFACLLFSFRSIGTMRERHFFYPFYQFMIAGVSGSFLTGDIFNLFVFFEVMLLSSYVLIVHGGTKIQLRESVKYVLVNVVSSILFVTGVGFLYRVTGTLNMAHLAQVIAEEGQGNLLTVIALFLLIVFALKASLFLYFWLPGSYQSPPVAVSAIFAALLTKVGIYAIIRVFSLIFIHQMDWTHSLIAWLATLTMILGSIGAIAYNDIGKVLVYNVVAAVGLVVLGFAIFSQTSLEGTIYYLLHDVIVKGLLFLCGGTLIMLAGTSNVNKMNGWMRKKPALGWIFFVTAVSVAGIPPLSGFVGKLLIVQGGLTSGNATYYWMTGIALLSSLMLLYSLVKVFMLAFWAERDGAEIQSRSSGMNLRGLVAPCVFLLSLSVLLGVGAEWMHPYVSEAARTLLEPAHYINAVLKE